MKKYAQVGAVVLMFIFCLCFANVEQSTDNVAHVRAGVTEQVVPDIHARIIEERIEPLEVAEIETEETVIEEIPEEIPEEVTKTETADTGANEPENEPETVETIEIPQEPTETAYGVLNKRDGVNYYNGQKETYYNLRMSGVIRLMEDLGIYADYWVRDDGVKMYGEYVMVATDTRRLPKGTIIDTSLGLAMVCDHCGSAESYPGTWVDIAVNW